MNRLYNKVRERFGGANSGSVTIREQPTGTLPTPATSRKPEVAVAPQPQTQRTRHRHQRETDVDRNQQFATAVERRSSSSGLVLPAYQAYFRNGGEERLVDGPPPSPKDSRVTQLEQRVRELEAMVVGQAAANNTAVVIPVTPTQQAKRMLLGFSSV
ncbi:hypothetical protein ANCDUO_02978 [Ancylostoma duodenale]|uniref:Uncharacterized protein n=1 Tax=Ancylostoma duodenale TaxID=51022 RepID=A0A0C2HB05_9BILA|nr:hypothetical protein ANCDUO_02978 [Ancylostoma duodenale]